MDQWGILASRQAQIMEMVRSHVLLVLPPDSQPNFRSFDHPEFRDFFVAQALKGHLRAAMADGRAEQLARFLTYAPLSDGTAGYVSGMVDRTPDGVVQAIEALCARVRDEWRPTHLQTNAGTLVASLLDTVAFTETAVVDGPLVMSSLVFEDSRVTNVRFIGCHFVNLSLRGARWNGVVLEGSEVTELRVDRTSSYFENVVLDRTRVSCVKVSIGDEEDEREYSPTRITSLLSSLGIDSDAQQPSLEGIETVEDYDSWRLGRRFLSLFSRSTTVTDHMLMNKFHNGGTVDFVRGTLIPLMISNDLVEERSWRGSGSGRVWSLRRSLGDILSAVDRPSDPANQFWRELATS